MPVSSVVSSLFSCILTSTTPSISRNCPSIVSVLFLPGIATERALRILKSLLLSSSVPIDVIPTLLITDTTPGIIVTGFVIVPIVGITSPFSFALNAKLVVPANNVVLSIKYHILPLLSDTA